MAPSRKDATPAPRKRPPAKTPEERENQLISLAIGLAEKQITEGTASSQVITHYLKLGTTREQLEKEKLKQENQLLQAKVEQMATSGRTEEMYSEALRAMRSYQGAEVNQDDDY